MRTLNWYGKNMVQSFVARYGCPTLRNCFQATKACRWALYQEAEESSDKDPGGWGQIEMGPECSADQEYHTLVLVSACFIT